MSFNIPKDQILVWQANEKNSTVIIPKPIPWECLTQSKEWNFKQLLALKPIPRRSYSAGSSNSFLEILIPSKRSNVHSNLEEVDFSSTIPDLKYYRLDQNLQISPNRSPTYSQMMSPNDEPAQLMVMIAIFEIDKEYLRTEAKSSNHVEQSKWFFSKLTNKQKENFKTQWYQTMKTMEINIQMITYFNIYITKNNIDYPFAEISMFQND